MATVLNGARVRETVSVVLMARLVDRQGHIVGPDAVDSIEYSLYRSDEFDIGGIYAEVICDREPLCVADVIFRQPRDVSNGDADATGFNFRHCFVIPSSVADRFDRAARFEVRYAVTQITGETTIVRFRIRMTRNDRC